MAMTRSPLRILLRALALSSLALLLALPASAQNDWQLALESVRVDQQREDSGDRPYFATITFTAWLNVPRAPRVALHEREPHDWVSKAEYQAGRRLRRGDHMSAGEVLPLPTWMGLHTWEGLEVRPRAEAFGAPIFGALIVSFDNNNTPPHEVRGILTQVETRLRDSLRVHVSGGRILDGISLADLTRNPGAVVPTLRDRLTDLAFSLTRDLGFNAINWTIGSTFNPDKMTGITAFVFVGIEGIDRTEVTSRDPGRRPITIYGDRIHWRAIYGTPSSFLERVLFEGSGARYTVPVRFRGSGSTAPAEVRVSRLPLRIRTGDDDLREGSRVRAVAFDARGGALGSTDLNQGRRWADRSEHNATLTLERPVPLADIARIELRFTSGDGFSGDNWNADMVTVFSAPGSAALWSRQGRPLHRFTGDDGVFSIALR